MLNSPQFFNHIFVVFLIDVGDHIADAFVGLQVLSHNVDVVIGQALVDARQDAGHIIVNVNQAVGIFQRRQYQVGEINTVGGAARELYSASRAVQK